MNDLDQIAEEAAKQLIGREGVSSRYYQEYNQAIIKSAIEKAVADIVAQYDELKAIANARFCGHCDIGDSDAECTCGNYDLRPSRAAHRVEKDAAGASEQWKLCECGHLGVDHRREKDHDECTVGECECDRLRLKPAGTTEKP